MNLHKLRRMLVKLLEGDDLITLSPEELREILALPKLKKPPWWDCVELDYSTFHGEQARRIQNEWKERGLIE